MNKLIIAPHLDDEVIGCGGILDSNCNVLFCGLQLHHEVSNNERLIELKDVQEHFNFSSIILNVDPVNRYDGRRYIDIFQKYINKHQPDRIYIPYTSYNQDHQQIYNAAMIALRPHDRNHFVRQVLVYEGMGAFQWYKSDYEVNHFVEIDIERKVEGYKLYPSQVRGHRSPDHIRALAEVRGSQINVPYAEAYMIKRWVE